MASTTHLGITLLETAQAQKEITINEAFARIDAILNTGIIDKDLSTPPVSPLTGDCYIVAAAATGAWAGKSTQVAYFDQIWRFIIPNRGLMLWVNDENIHYIYDGTVWQVQASADISKSVYDPANISQQLVGINATQTLANKTLTAPRISSIVNTGTLTLPTTTDTLVGRATTDTLTNKTLTNAVINGPTTVTSFIGTTTLGLVLGGSTGTSYGGLDFRGTVSSNSIARIAVIGGANGSSLVFGTSNSYAAGITTATATMANGLVVGAPTGGDKGVGTINASAVYDDNALLTCYVGEAYRTGTINVEYWDQFAPEIDGERRHEKARGFALVAHDRLDTEKFCQFFKDTGRLPAFPSPDRWQEAFEGKMATGDLVQRLWETIEVLTVHISKLHNRVSTLEAIHG